MLGRYLLYTIHNCSMCLYHKGVCLKMGCPKSDGPGLSCICPYSTCHELGVCPFDADASPRGLRLSSLGWGSEGDADRGNVRSPMF